MHFRVDRYKLGRVGSNREELYLWGYRVPNDG
jgi:hypothetical protein